MPVDFTDFAALKGGYDLDQETPKALEAWFAWAIANFVQSGETYDTNHVWNPETREPELCKPGRGFFSPPTGPPSRVWLNGKKALWALAAK